MKLLSLLALLASCLPSLAQVWGSFTDLSYMGQGRTSTGGGGGACTTSNLWIVPIVQQQITQDDYSGFLKAGSMHQKIHNTSAVTNTIRMIRWQLQEVAGVNTDAYTYVMTNITAVAFPPQIGGYSVTNAIPASMSPTVKEFIFTEANAPVIPPNTDFYISIRHTSAGAPELRVRQKNAGPYEGSLYGLNGGTDDGSTAVDAYFEVYVCDSGGYDPLLVSPTYWWHAPDISSNTPIASWNDRILGKQIVQTFDYYKPTNSTDGVCFDGRKWMQFTDVLPLSNQSNSTVMVIGRFANIPHPQALLWNTNGTAGFSVFQDNRIIPFYESGTRGDSGAMNASNQVDMAFTIRPTSTTIGLAIHTNGVYSSSNSFSSTMQSYMKFVGGFGPGMNPASTFIDFSSYGYIQDILIWTNAALAQAQLTYLHDWAVTNYDATAKTPLWNPNFYPGLLEWARADAGTIGAVHDKNQTNGMGLGYLPSGYNPDASASRYFGGGAVTWYSNITAGSSVGRPAMSSTTGGGLLNTSASVTTSNQPCVWFAVLQATNLNLGGANQAIMDSGGSRQAHYPSIGGSSAILHAGTSAFYPFPWVITNRTLMTWCFNGANSWIRTNGVSMATALDTGTAAFRQPVNLMFGNGGSSTFFGYLFELFGYQSDNLTTNHIIEIEDQLMSKYGITSPSVSAWQNMAFRLTATNVATSASVSNWVDVIQGVTMYNTSAGSRPSKDAGSTNGVYFDRNVNEYFPSIAPGTVNYSQTPNASNDIAVYAIFKPVSTPSGVYYALHGSSGGVLIGIHPSLTVNYSSNDEYGPCVVNQLNVYVANEGYYKTNRGRWVNGVTNTTSTSPYTRADGSTVPFVMNQVAIGGSYLMDGPIYEIGVWTNKIITAAEAFAIYRYATNQFR